MHITSEQDAEQTTSVVTGLIPARPSVIQILSHIISELSQNAVQHSGTSGYVSAEYFPETAAIHFCVADYGCGLMSSLSAAYTPHDDAQAIVYALRPGVSAAAPHLGARHQRNRGIGLAAAHRLTTQNGGVFEVWTGRGRLCHLRGDERPPSFIGEFWPGTLISCLLPCDRAVAGFTSVMDGIRIELAESERKRPTRYRRKTS